MEEYDLTIIGAGPAGLTAAIYSARYNLKTLVIASSFGGTANLAGEIENWPGTICSGPELVNKMKEQAEQFGAEFLQDNVKEINKNQYFEIKTSTKTIKTKAIILALGSKHRELGIEGEKEFLGKGVSYCATCDAFFYKDKTDFSVLQLFF
ncbi:MAG: NAD(P)/FAD-dependent oxidoreductase, partial [Candidatus Nanoarchaeia archaeon]